MNHLLAYLASWLLGYLILNILFRKNTLPGPGLTLILSAGLGLALSATITFFSYILFDRLNAFIVAITHVIFIFILILEKMPDSTAPKKFFSNFRNLRLNAFLYPLIIVLASTPLIFHANFFPWGGWDAWSCWNLKAKFLFVGGEDWKDLFSPILWRSSPHYPLLLPLINVWGWIGTGSPSHVIPLMTSIIFTFLVAGLTFFGLKIFIKDFYALLAALLMLYLPFFVTQTSS